MMEKTENGSPADPVLNSELWQTPEPVIRISFEQQKYFKEKFLEGEPIALGVAQITLAFILISLTSSEDYKFLFFVRHTWIFPMLFIVSGSLTLASAKKLKLSMIHACLVTNVASALLSSLFVIHFSAYIDMLWFQICSPPLLENSICQMANSSWAISKILLIYGLLFVLLEFGVCITTAIYCCKVIRCCCPGNKLGATLSLSA
ncbi:membrane-spanning 4-domains subfamily A member 4A isoform X2 [Latimeria chalumnae]|uniref:membrane-spanning 4-domains subfamily A member 4A isoform X2 n=1 Tax=Latimeria chalumnae TaxID=7897 RepID=UPI0003C1316E|nr:PREDICTED: membrane-spanning 4-domains subfamily A member 4A-like isoform X2 [Latimeria chalumnae]|eukprot:XP_006014082.1 PREDICTED: membrane-spanning 4-domains subfamily A member 4A-like isoform X2 [Latimeria chalumnae]